MKMLGALDLEDLLHSRARLALLAYLSTAGSADFTVLRDYTRMTDGNLSTHLRKLEDAGYIETEKAFVHRRPRTTVALTAEGRTAFETYIDTLEQVIKSARAGIDGEPR